MSKIVSVGTAVPPHEFKQKDIQNAARELFKEDFQDIDRLMKVFDSGQIESRYFCMPMAWFAEPKPFSERNRLYVEESSKLSLEAIEKCLAGTGVVAQDINHFIFISSTGLSTPSIDAYLINELKMDTHIVRTPIWGLGCTGGAVGLSRAFHFTKAYPESLTLMVSIELSSLTFQHSDRSKSNLIATSLFGDGAAAVLITGERVNLKGPKILGAKSTIWEGSLDVMGWTISDNGLKVLFSRDIPSIVYRYMRPNVDSFLGEFNLSPNEIDHFITHPGGAKVIRAYEDALNITDGKMRHTWEVLRRYGNMSSPTVLFVLQRFMKDPAVQSSDYGLVSALGPGFSSELLLIQW